MREVVEYGSTTNRFETSNQRFKFSTTTSITTRTATTAATTTAFKANNLSLTHRRRNVSHTTPSYVLSSGQFCEVSERKRKERIMAYNAYSMEGKMKASIRSSFKWVKGKCSSFVHGC
ncbi:hypothetical protein ACS0TY_027250 [Phlomoides rotata]